MKNTSKQSRKNADKEHGKMHEKFNLYEVPKFGISFKGYNRNEVNKYLEALVNEYIRLIEENFKMKSELEGYIKNQQDIHEPLSGGKAIELGFDIEELINDLRTLSED